MQFNHDNMIGVHLAEDLVNLDADDRWTAPDVAALLTGARVNLDGLDDSLGALRNWTRNLAAVFRETGIAARCERINDLLDTGVRRVFLAMHDELPPHLHFVGDEETISRRVQALTIGGLAIFAVEARAERMGVCDRPGCERVYVDTSRNGRRSYCSALCGNHHAVQRYRDRRT